MPSQHTSYTVMYKLDTIASSSTITSCAKTMLAPKMKTMPQEQSRPPVSLNLKEWKVLDQASTMKNPDHAVVPIRDRKSDEPNTAKQTIHLCCLTCHRNIPSDADIKLRVWHVSQAEKTPCSSFPIVIELYVISVSLFWVSLFRVVFLLRV